MKYFVLGAFSSAIFVYGIALTYGATGSTNLAQIGAFLARNVIVDDGVLVAGLALLIVGFGFKIAAVPFTCGRPTSTKGADPASASWPRWPRSVASPRCCASCCRACRRSPRTGSRRCG